MPQERAVPAMRRAEISLFATFRRRCGGRGDKAAILSEPMSRNSTASSSQRQADFDDSVVRALSSGTPSATGSRAFNESQPVVNQDGEQRDDDAALQHESGVGAVEARNDHFARPLRRDRRADRRGSEIDDHGNANTGQDDR